MSNTSLLVGGEGPLMTAAGMSQCMPVSPFVTMAPLWPLQCPRWASLAHASSSMAYDDSSTTAGIHNTPPWIVDRHHDDGTGCDYDVRPKQHVCPTATTTIAATTPLSGLAPSFSPPRRHYAMCMRWERSHPALPSASAVDTSGWDEPSNTNTATAVPTIHLHTGAGAGARTCIAARNSSRIIINGGGDRCSTGDQSSCCFDGDMHRACTVNGADGGGCRLTVELGKAISSADEDGASSTVKQAMAMWKAGATALADTDAAADRGNKGIDLKISALLDTGASSTGVSGGSICIAARIGSHIMMITNGGSSGGGGGCCSGGQSSCFINKMHHARTVNGADGGGCRLLTVELGKAASGVDEDADEDEASTTVMKQTMAMRKAGGTTTLADTDAAADGGRTGIDHKIGTPAGLDETGASSTGVSGEGTCTAARRHGSHIMLMITNGGDGGGDGGGSCPGGWLSCCVDGVHHARTVNGAASARCRLLVGLGKAAGAHEDGAPTVMKQAMAMRKAGGPAGTTASTPASDEPSELDSCMVLGSAGHQGLGCSLSDPSLPPFQLVTDAPPAGGRLPSPFGALVWLPLATVQPLTEAAPSKTSTVMVPREQRRLAGEYVVESYAALKSLTACPDNSNAACDFSGKALVMRCNGKQKKEIDLEIGTPLIDLSTSTCVAATAANVVATAAKEATAAKVAATAAKVAATASAKVDALANVATHHSHGWLLSPFGALAWMLFAAVEEAEAVEATSLADPAALVQMAPLLPPVTQALVARRLADDYASMASEDNDVLVRRRLSSTPCSSVTVSGSAIPSWIVGTWTLDPAETCGSGGRPTYKRTVSGGAIRYLSYVSSISKWMVNSAACVDAGWLVTVGQDTATLPYQVTAGWEYWSGSWWVIDSTAAAEQTCASYSPTAAPTNVGDTHSPTDAPTDAPTLESCGVNCYVVESYAALKSLTACPDNSNAACDFSGKALIMRCNGKTLDANLEKRIFYGYGSGSSLQVHGCVLTRGKGEVSVVLGVALRASC